MSEGGMVDKISVGSLATAKRDSGICSAGEVGVCYEVYQLDNRPGYSFIFERGGYDGFSPDDVRTFLDVKVLCTDAATYDFQNVGRLDADYRAGRFEKAFEEGREFASVPHWPEAETAPGKSNAFEQALESYYADKHRHEALLEPDQKKEQDTDLDL